jgi:hypothetical protein
MDYKKFLDGINLDLNKHLRMYEDVVADLHAAREKSNQKYDDYWAQKDEQEKAKKEREEKLAQDLAVQPKTADQPQGPMPDAPAVWFTDKESYTFKQLQTIKNIVLYNIGMPSEREAARKKKKKVNEAFKPYVSEQGKARATAKTLEPYFDKYVALVGRDHTKVDFHSHFETDEGVQQLRQQFINWASFAAARDKNQIGIKAVQDFAQRHELEIKNVKVAPTSTSTTPMPGIPATTTSIPNDIRDGVWGGLMTGASYVGAHPEKDPTLMKWWNEVQSHLHKIKDEKEAASFGMQYAAYKKHPEDPSFVDPIKKLQQESFFQKLRSQILA